MAKRARKAYACGPCRAHKVKCDHGIPCSACTRYSRVDRCLADPSPSPSRNKIKTIGSGALSQTANINSFRGEILPKPKLQAPLDAVSRDEKELSQLKTQITTLEDFITSLKSRAAKLSTKLKKPPSSSEVAIVRKTVYELAHIINTPELYLQHNELGLGYAPLYDVFNITSSAQHWQHITANLIPTREQCDKLVSVYFQNVHWCLNPFHIPTFNKHLEYFWKIDGTELDLTWMSILLMVLSLGLMYFPKDQINSLGISSIVKKSQKSDSKETTTTKDNGTVDDEALTKLCSIWFECAKSALLADDFTEKPKLGQVITFALVELYCHLNNKLAILYNFLSGIIVNAYTLNLHKETSSSDPSKINYLEIQGRRKAWWTIVTCDCFFALHFNRPPLIKVRSVDVVPLPANINDEDVGIDFINEKPVDIPTSNSFNIWWFKLHLIMAELYDEVPPSPDMTEEELSYSKYVKMLKVDKKLSDYYKAKPWYYQLNAQSHLQLTHPNPTSPFNRYPFQKRHELMKQIHFQHHTLHLIICIHKFRMHRLFLMPGNSYSWNCCFTVAKVITSVYKELRANYSVDDAFFMMQLCPIFTTSIIQAMVILSAERIIDIVIDSQKSRGTQNQLTKFKTEMSFEVIKYLFNDIKDILDDLFLISKYYTVQIPSLKNGINLLNYINSLEKNVDDQNKSKINENNEAKEVIIAEFKTLNEENDNCSRLPSFFLKVYEAFLQKSEVSVSINGETNLKNRNKLNDKSSGRNTIISSSIETQPISSSFPRVSTPPTTKASYNMSTDCKDARNIGRCAIEFLVNELDGDKQDPKAETKKSLLDSFSPQDNGSFTSAKKISNNDNTDTDDHDDKNKQYFNLILKHTFRGSGFKKDFEHSLDDPEEHHNMESEHMEDFWKDFTSFKSVLDSPPNDEVIEKSKKAVKRYLKYKAKNRIERILKMKRKWESRKKNIVNNQTAMEGNKKRKTDKNVNSDIVLHPQTAPINPNLTAAVHDHVIQRSPSFLSAPIPEHVSTDTTQPDYHQSNQMGPIDYNEAINSYKHNGSIMMGSHINPVPQYSSQGNRHNNCNPLSATYSNSQIVKQNSFNNPKFDCDWSYYNSQSSLLTAESQTDFYLGIGPGNTNSLNGSNHNYTNEQEHRNGHMLNNSVSVNEYNLKQKASHQRIPDQLNVNSQWQYPQPQQSTDLHQQQSSSNSFINTTEVQQQNINSIAMTSNDVSTSVNSDSTSPDPMSINLDQILSIFPEDISGLPTLSFNSWVSGYDF